MKCSIDVPVNSSATVVCVDGKEATEDEASASPQPALESLRGGLPREEAATSLAKMRAEQAGRGRPTWASSCTLQGVEPRCGRYHGSMGDVRIRADPVDSSRHNRNLWFIAVARRSTPNFHYHSSSHRRYGRAQRERSLCRHHWHGRNGPDVCKLSGRQRAEKVPSTPSFRCSGP